MMNGSFSKGYLRFSWVTLVFIYLVIIAGSIVRTTGSGMGCPDWPTCFGKIVPPTCACELPDNYQETYLAQRKEKVDKFANLIAAFGFNDLSEKIKNDQSILVEEEFNAARTWTEYGNRLVGFLAGNCVLILFVWTLIRYRQKRVLLTLTFLNLILIGLNGWIGSVVVATNLLPWTITVHMMLALLNVAVHIKIIRIIKNRSFQIKIKPLFKYLFYFSLLLTFVQIVLGAQVRQEIDFMVKDAVSRPDWIANMKGDFYFHRSFSWILLACNLLLLFFNKKWLYGIPAIKWIVALILFEFLTGVLFSYAGMPAILQPLHLLTAAVLLGIQLFALDFFRYKSQSMLR